IAWMDRLAAFGHGISEEMSAGDAIDVARNSTIAPVSPSSNIHGVAVGDPVEVSPADYGMDPVSGTLLLADGREIVVTRNDERAGEVAVHFPRFCYTLRKL